MKTRRAKGNRQRSRAERAAGERREILDYIEQCERVPPFERLKYLDRMRDLALFLMPKAKYRRMLETRRRMNEASWAKPCPQK